MVTTAKKPAAKVATAAKTQAGPKAKPTASIPATAAAPKTVTATVKTDKGAKPVKEEKARKPKMVRDSFTIPKAEYAVLDELKLRAAKAGAPAKKSELLRAGIKALAAMPADAFLAAVGAVPAIKTGRPAKA